MPMYKWAQPECSPHRHKTQTSSDDATFFVIDLEEMRLVRRHLSSSFDYVTLSYVWGGQNSSETTTENFESRLKKGGLKSSFLELPTVVRVLAAS